MALDTWHSVLGDIQCHNTRQTNKKKGMEKKNRNTRYHVLEDLFLPHVFIVSVQKLEERERKKY